MNAADLAPEERNASTTAAITSKARQNDGRKAGTPGVSMPLA
jgi:hypothetical protein